MKTVELNGYMIHIEAEELLPGITQKVSEAAKMHNAMDVSEYNEDVCLEEIAEGFDIILLKTFDDCDDVYDSYIKFSHHFPSVDGGGMMSFGGRIVRPLGEIEELIKTNPNEILNERWKDGIKGFEQNVLDRYKRGYWHNGSTNITKKE